ncbi:MAG: NAD(+)/NADH kinase [Chloroflexi bacterium]|nr:NAD(+)/NADH kinase [Chloroflexota bacterium]
MIKKVAIVLRPAPPQPAEELANAVCSWLSTQGVTVWRGIVPDSGAFDKILPEVELVFAFGGDGTILHAAKLAAAHGVPIVGIDFGRLGFLAELNPTEALSKISAFIHREYWLEERAMLHAELVRNGEVVSEFLALNDIVIGRSFLSGVIDVRLHINEEHVTTYIGDGVIVSTSTGSTAYNLAVGGPVIAPTMKAIAVSAIAPHLSHLSHLLMPETAKISFYVGTRKGAAVTIDGQPDFAIEDKDVVNVVAGPYVAYFARVQPQSYFYTTLATRLRRGV